MILDDRSELTAALPINTAIGTANLGDVIDLGLPPLRDMTTGLYLVGIVSATCTSAGAATAQFRLVSDDTMAPSTSSPSVHLSTGAIPVASMTAGARLFVFALDGLRNVERYLGMQQVTAGAAFTAGAVSIFITSEPASCRPYSDNVA